MRKATTAGLPFQIEGTFTTDREGFRTDLIVGRDEEGTVMAFKRIMMSGSVIGWQQMNGSDVDAKSVPAEFVAAVEE